MIKDNCIVEIDGYALQKINENDKFFGIYDFKVVDTALYAIVQDKGHFRKQVELAIVLPKDQDEDLVDFKLLGNEQSLSFRSA